MAILNINPSKYSIAFEIAVDVKNHLMFNEYVDHYSRYIKILIKKAANYLSIFTKIINTTVKVYRINI